jgi:hypothetical protein
VGNMKKIAFVNEFDLNRNNSAGITVRDLFGEELCEDSLQICLLGGEVVASKHSVILYKSKMNYRAIVDTIKIIKNEKVDVIYTTGNSLKMLTYLFLIRINAKVPILFHYFDNWRESRHPVCTNVLLRLINGKHEQAFVISEEMKEHYQNRYDGNYSVLMVGSPNSVNNGTINSGNKGKFYFLYAGGVHLGRVNALLEFEETLRDHNINGKLIIATFNKDYEENVNKFDEDYTTFLVDIDHHQIANCYAEANALLFVEPAPINQTLFLKYSMSTKIPEYLSSGLPIICISRPGIACYEYFKRNNCAYLATNRDEIETSIYYVTHSDEENKSKVSNALVAALRDFDREKQRDELFRVINQVCSK